MIAKKICMLGAFSVGKTSLVEHYVHAHFSEEYLSTAGVKISKKNLEAHGVAIDLVFWDMEGKDDFHDVSLPYLRDADGAFLVADGMRKETLDAALELHHAVSQSVNAIPKILLINKADRRADWEITETDLDRAREKGFSVFATSAKTGEGIDKAFDALAQAVVSV